MHSPTPEAREVIASPLRSVLRDHFDIEATRVHRIHAGTASDNFITTTPDAMRWFVKVYRSANEAVDATAAIELTEFSGRGGTPVASLRRTRRGDVVAHSHGLSLSVWEFIDAQTAEGGLRGGRWHTLGSVIGRLHHHLTTHPYGRPTLADPVELLDLATATASYDQLIEEYRHHDATSDAFTQWAIDALLERRALLPRVLDMLQRLPPLTKQILHGDLAAPNVLMRGDHVAAVIDFQPPSVGFLAWEIARIACDPRTLVTNPRWREELPGFLESYQAAHQGVQLADLTSAVAVGCAYTIASTYPLSVNLHHPEAMTDALKTYGQHRHRAALAMLETASCP